jgi:hypothetical protein
MQAFLLAMIAIVGISFLASIGLETVEMSAEQANTSNSVRLD